MSVFKYPFPNRYDYMERCVLEAKARRLAGVNAATFDGSCVKLWVKPGQNYARLGLSLSKLIGSDLLATGKEVIKHGVSQLKVKKENVDIGLELISHRNSALLSLAAMGLFSVVKKVSPTVYSSLLIFRSLGVLVMARDLIKGGIKDAVKEKRPNADTLTVTAVLASVAAGRPESSMSLLALSNFAEMLTVMAAQRARKNISSLVALDVQEVWVHDENGAEVKMPVEKVKPGMVVSIHSGEKICVDGIIKSGSAAVDQSAITGESIPVAKKAGDKVYAGSNIRLGEIEVLVDKVGDDTSLSRIVHMVEDAQNRRAPIQNYADHMASSLVPVSFIAALMVYAATRDWQRVLNMLFIDFSCGLKLSTATAMSAAISRAAKEGILVKGGSFIEGAAQIDTVILDKTGTITRGRPQIVRITLAPDVNESVLLQMAASAEAHSSHPLAVAILEEVKNRGLEIPPHLDTKTVIARGIEAHLPAFDDCVGGEVLVGSKSFMEESKVDGLDFLLPKKQSPVGSFIYIALNKKLCGILEISDPVRAEFKRAINRMRYNGIEEIIMLTGDNKEAAKAIADSLGLDGFKAEVMPEDKAGYVSQKQRNSSVLMVGDGINDAPALAYADIGVAMGTACTDTAMESADVTINSEDPLKLPQFISIGKRTMALVHQNFAVTIAVNTAAMMLGALGFINPLLASVVHNASTLGVVLNSARILIPDKKKNY